MSYKMIKRQHKNAEEIKSKRRFALRWAIQTKLTFLNYELTYIDEFSLSDRSFKFFGWSKKGKSKFISTISDSFKMSFYVAFSKYKFYGIIDVEGTGTSQNFIHFLSKVLKERKWWILMKLGN